MGIIVAGFISAFGAYLVAAKKMSGEVRNSDAEQLWAESRSMREWSSDRIADLTGNIGSLEGRVKNLEDRNTNLLQENAFLHDKIRDLKDELLECNTIVEELNRQIRLAKELISDLETTASLRNLGKEED